MNLFIDAISNPAKLILFNDKREIIDSFEWEMLGNESSSLSPKIDDFLKKNSLSYFDLENIVVVNGPGSFTGVRTIVLVVNTINYIINKNITSLSYFDLFNNFPIIKSSSKRDSFVKYTKDLEIEIIYNDELLEKFKKENINKIYGETNSDLFENIEILEKVDYAHIIETIEFDEKKIIEPLYIKKPNIS